MTTPAKPKIYHIVHVDRLPSIIENDGLLCDAQMVGRQGTGTVIGMDTIKERRLKELTLSSHPDLYVGRCVPFYFCPRSVMLYLLYRGNHPDVTYRGGQGPIVHLEADLYRTVKWAEINNMRWAFTLSNAGSSYFEDRNDLNSLGEIKWQAVQARKWERNKDEKQAEFLLEIRFPWQLVDRIGVYSQGIATQALGDLAHSDYKPRVEIKKRWYY